jgi:phosphoglycolate phosphatase-like HAD superfamily hydrolase
MKDYRRLFLDLDGTLLDGRLRHYRCYRSILEAAGFTPIAPEPYWEMKRAMTNRRELLALSGAEALYDHFLATWLATIESPAMLALDQLQEGVLAVLQEWRSQGRMLVLVTLRQDAAALEQQLVQLGLRPLFEAVLVCRHTDGGEGKATAIRGRYPGQDLTADSLLIGDTEADWAAARALGIDVVLVANGLRTAPFLSALEGATVVPALRADILARATPGDAN